MPTPRSRRGISGWSLHRRVFQHPAFLSRHAREGKHQTIREAAYQSSCSRTTSRHARIGEYPNTPSSSAVMLAKASIHVTMATENTGLTKGHRASNLDYRLRGNDSWETLMCRLRLSGSLGKCQDSDQSREHYSPLARPHPPNTSRNNCVVRAAGSSRMRCSSSASTVNSPSNAKSVT